MIPKRIFFEWFGVLGKTSFSKHGEWLNHLKKEHGVTHGFANTIVARYKKKDEGEVDLVQQQYYGKEGLVPIYHGLIEFVQTLGDDISITPKKTSVSVIRAKQFILIKPATKTRIDLGLKLKDHPTTDRLGDSGPFGTMCTHRVTLSASTDVDDELKSWIKEAYSQST